MHSAANGETHRVADAPRRDRDAARDGEARFDDGGVVRRRGACDVELGDRDLEAARRERG